MTAVRLRTRVAEEPGLLVGAVLVLALVATAALSLVWTPYPPTAIDPTGVLQPPSLQHWLGTDAFGRDVVSQLMAGSRTTLLVGVLAVLIAGAIGVPIGLIAAFRRGWAGQVVLRGNDILLAFPALLIAMMLAAGFGASTATATAAIALGSLPAFVSIARSATATVLTQPFIEAARLGGLRGPMIAWRHVLPNIAPTLLVQASVVFAFAVLAEAALSYLGLGTPPPTPTWGRMLQEAQGYLASDPRLAIAPGVAIAAAVLGFSLLGDGLRDRLDPRLQRSG